MKAITMPKQHDWLLPAIALLILSTANVLFRVDQRLPEVVWDGRDLIAGFEPKDLTRISFKTGSKSFSLTREGEGFVVDTQNSTPVDTQKLNEVLLRLGGSQIAEVIGGKEDWERLNVSDKNTELEMELLNRGENAKWKVLLGKSVPGKQGRAVRIDGKDEVFVTREYMYIPTNDTDYVSQTALNIAKSKITSFDLFHKNQKLDEAKFIKDDLLSSLEPMKVKPHFKTGDLPADLNNLQWDWSAQLVNDKGQMFNVSWAESSGRWFAKAHSDLNQTISAGPVMDFKLLALKADVERFNQQKMPWIWELSPESVEILKRGLKK